MAHPIEEAFPYLFFSPNGKQDEFLKMHGFVNVFSAANKVGKTAVGAIKLIYAMKNSRIRARVGGDPTAISAMVVPEIEKWLGQEARYWDIQKKGYKYNSYFKAPNGSVCDVLTYEQKPKEWESVPLDYLWLDEPPPHKIWGACTSRFLTAGELGEINLTMTPLWGAAWVHDDLITKADGDRIKFLYADIEDNCIEHGVNGRLSHDKIQMIIVGYDADEIDARIHGQFGFLTGRVYKELDPAVHLVDPPEPPEGSLFFTINDPHDRKYPAISFVFMTPSEEFYVYDEFPNEPYENLKSCDLTIKDVAKIIREREGGHKFRRIMDPNFGMQRSAHTGRTTRGEYMVNGMPFVLGKNDMTLGHDAVRTLLNPEHPRLFISKKCRNHWHFMNRYAWKDFKGIAADEKSVSELVQDKFKDFCDNMRYLALDFPKYIAEKKAEREKDKKVDAHRVGHEAQLEKEMKLDTDVTKLV